MKRGQKQRPQRNELGGQDCMTSNVMQYDSNTVQYLSSGTDRSIQEEVFSFFFFFFFFFAATNASPKFYSGFKVTSRQVCVAAATGTPDHKNTGCCFFFSLQADKIRKKNISQASHKL